MKQIPRLSFAILSTIFIVMLPAIADDATPKNLDTIKVEAVGGFVAQNKNTVVLDVRTPEEYEISHVPGAININIWDESFAEKLGELDNDKTYIVYCTKNPVGGRSMTALAQMEALGFRNLKSLEGGHVAWTEAELPMTTKEEP